MFVILDIGEVIRRQVSREDGIDYLAKSVGWIRNSDCESPITA